MTNKHEELSHLAPAKEQMNVTFQNSKKNDRKALWNNKYEGNRIFFF